MRERLKTSCTNPLIGNKQFFGEEVCSVSLEHSDVTLAAEKRSDKHGDDDGRDGNGFSLRWGMRDAFCSILSRRIGLFG